MEILGVRIDEVDMDGAVKTAKDFLKTDKVDMIFTPNPEMLMHADEDDEFKKILNSSSLNIPDGNGIIWASQKMGGALKERVTGFDFIHKLFDLGKDKDITFYLLGAKEGIAKEAKVKIEEKFPKAKVVGTRNGYFANEEEEEIANDIGKLSPDVLLVALGAPKQEKFIYKYRDRLNCRIAIGVGGCLDVISGNVKRAPNIFIKLKLEWLYRGLTDIKRIKRLKTIPKFMYRINKEYKR